MDLYTFGTPNGHKISILLEELGVAYNVKKIDLRKNEQKSPDYLKINPNGKIPALIDGETVIFETIAIMIYLAELHGKFLPASGPERYKVLEWCMWQASGLAPALGQFGHYAVMAKEKVPYAIERTTEESHRVLKVLERRLEESRYIAGYEYTLADIATWPWIDGYQHFYKQHLDESVYPSIMRWYREIEARPAVQRGSKIPH